MDLIDRQAAIDALNEVSGNYTGKGDRNWHPHIDFMVQAIEELPSAERKGKWITYYHGGTDLSYSCNQCGAQAPFFWMSETQRKSNYCYNCGAKMESEDSK